MDIRYYAAYGSNLNTGQMARRCPGAQIVGKAVVQNHRLLCRNGLTGTYLTVEPEEGCAVPVGIWAVNADHERSLDEYERFPELYDKREMRLTVTDMDGENTRELDAFIYVMYRTYDLGVPTPAYVEACLAGYREFGFPQAVLHEAVAYSRRQACKEGESFDG